MLQPEFFLRLVLLLYMLAILITSISHEDEETVPTIWKQ